MADHSWILTDVASGTYVDQLELSRRDVKGAPGSFKINKTRLRGGLQDGVDLLHIDNGRVAVDLLPTRGMSLWRATIDGQTIGWDSPVAGPVHPGFVDLGEPSGLGWLDGFDEMMVRCGLESNGAPEFAENGQLVYPLHGRLGNRPAQHVAVEVDSDEEMITVRSVVKETRFHFFKVQLVTEFRMRYGEPAFHIHDRAINLSASPAEVQLLYHANFGQPLLDGGARVVAPLKTVVPRNEHAASGIDTWNSYTAAEAGFEEQVYFLQLLADDDGYTRMMLKNAHSTRGMSMRYKTDTLPCFSVWKNTTAQEDGSVTGLEPGTNYPNTRGYEGQQGRTAKLEPLGSVDFELSMSFQQSEADVAGVEDVISQLQGNTEPEIFREPQPGWCEDASG